MIDFRYHVVSLVSVFLALAVGIVLGAGPLKGEISNQLTTRVAQLADENADLASQLGTSRRAIQNRDTFTRAVLPQLAGAQLTGQRVVVVTVPGVDADGVTTLTDTLRLAGATVTGRVDVTASWTDPAHAADRRDLVRDLATPGTATPPASSPTPAKTATAGPSATVKGADGTDAALAGLLARSVVTREPSLVGRPDASATAALDALRKAGLVSVDGDLGHANQAVVLVPAVQAPGDQASTSSAPAVDPVAQWSALAVALDVVGDGTVVTGPASSAASGGVIAAIRGQDAISRSVSTVDTGGTPMGDLTTVLALREQAFGGSGRYGFAGSVDAPMPERRG